MCFNLYILYIESLHDVLATEKNYIAVISYKMILFYLKGQVIIPE